MTCLPGPSAVTTALVLSGLPVERFCFEGFAPRRAGERRRWLASLRAEPRAVVFFESPHRLAETLAAAVEELGGDRAAAVCRELTKTHEEVRRGSLAELAAWAAEGVRGEITVVLAGASAAAPSVGSLVGAVQERVADGERLKDAVSAVATAAGVPKRELYAAALAEQRGLTAAALPADPAGRRRAGPAGPGASARVDSAGPAAAPERGRCPRSAPGLEARRRGLRGRHRPGSVAADASRCSPHGHRTNSVPPGAMQPRQ